VKAAPSEAGCRTVAGGKCCANGTCLALATLRRVGGVHNHKYAATNSTGTARQSSGLEAGLMLEGRNEGADEVRALVSRALVSRALVSRARVRWWTA